jgi:hypothetical protein
MTSDDSVIEWLLAGDPVIRWQVMRDLLDHRPRRGRQNDAGR